MKRGTLFLKLVIYFLGLGALGVSLGMLTVVEPAKAGGYYPVVIIMVVSALPFLTALFQSLKLLMFIDRNNAFSEESAQALKRIKYCAMIISAAYALSMPYMFWVAEMDDAPGGSTYWAHYCKCFHSYCRICHCSSKTRTKCN
jgi:hypothetical protein